MPVDLRTPKSVKRYLEAREDFRDMKSFAAQFEDGMSFRVSGMEISIVTLNDETVAPNVVAFDRAMSKRLVIRIEAIAADMIADKKAALAALKITAIADLRALADEMDASEG